jgi:hypothetical protein
MKKLIYYFFVFIISISAQSINTKVADKVESHDYVQAVQEYLALTEKGNSDPYVMKQLETVIII